jgi:hypothetical protein
MLKKFKESSLTDLKNIFSNYRFLIALLILVWLSFLHSLIFPVFSDYFYSKSGLRLEEYYSLFTVTCISIIPALIGTLCGKIQKKDILTHDGTKNSRNSEVLKEVLLMRIAGSAILTFIIVAIAVIIIKPVHGQGWLRNLSAVLLLSVQTVMVFMYVLLSGGFRYEGFYNMVTWLLLLALPFGMLFHHPWNFISFLSPFYWIGWEWLIVNPADSLIYGGIALVLTSGATLILLKMYFRKSSF